VRKSTRVFFTSILGVALVAPIQTSPAVAAITAATVSPALSVGTGTVQVFGSSTQTFTNPSPAPLLLGPLENKDRSLFYAQNNGTISTPAFNVTISLTDSSTITSVKRCDVGVLFIAAGVCASGSATAIPMTPGVVATISSLMAPNTFYNLELITEKKTTATIDLSVLTSQLGTRTINS